jgi:hypothetical protein
MQRVRGVFPLVAFTVTGLGLGTSNIDASIGGSSGTGTGRSSTARSRGTGSAGSDGTSKAGRSPAVDRGRPACGVDEVDCGGDAGRWCTSTDTDPAHCGDCGNTCAGTEVCGLGVCARTCSVGLKLCGASCVDTASDEDHCGDCGQVCADTEVCSGGECGCPAGTSESGGTCVDLATASRSLGFSER